MNSSVFVEPQESFKVSNILCVDFANVHNHSKEKLLEMRSLLAQNCKSDQDDRLVFSLLTFRKLLKGQSVLWLKLNKLDLGGEKVFTKSSSCSRWAKNTTSK